MADTPNGETPPVTPPKNDPPAPATPPLEEKKTDDAAIEELRKKAEQAEMRANQLQNQLKAKEDAEAATKAKELEQQNEFKTLYEQEKAKREEIERDSELAEQKKQLEESRTGVLSDYSDDVKALAEETGIALADVTEDAVAEFKAKLDKIQTRLGTASKVTPNNPGTPSSKQEYSRDELYVILNDPVKRDEYYRKKDGVTAMMMAPPK